MIPVNRPRVDDTDVQAVVQALEDTWLSGETPPVAELERLLEQTVGTRHAIAVSTGTSACDLITEALDIRPGTSIIAPATTIISTVSHAARRGAQLHIVDVDPDTWCISPELVASIVDDKVMAIYAVHLYGLVADMHRLRWVAESTRSALVEDAAEALGQTYLGAQCGSLGHAASISFYANKVVTAGEGGAILTSDDNLAAEVRRLRNLYFDPSERFIHEELGYNARMAGLVAALAQSQLKRIDAILATKRSLGRQYLSNLAGHPWLRLPPAATDQTENSFWVFPVLLEESTELSLQPVRARLLELGVDTRRLFFPLNKQPALLKTNQVIQYPTPVADALWDRGFYLPSGVGTTPEEVDTVSEMLWDLVREF